ncbi:GRAM domain-containing protein 2B [Alosa alosa]|uniref:GRAM domain-containing protein 2B n=1 Tax=Alosa alosa TaxID=278164 RepID=UPI0020151124|nr:GRAM domain-containing protein 2B [Alosa alosa]
MLENKRERLKTFLRKIDEKAIFKLKHFMKESTVLCSGGEHCAVLCCAVGVLGCAMLWVLGPVISVLMTPPAATGPEGDPQFKVDGSGVMCREMAQVDGSGVMYWCDVQVDGSGVMCREMAQGGPIPSGKVRKGKSSKKKAEPRKALSLEESQLESLQPSHSPRLPPIRSQTFDSDRSFERTDSIGSRSSFIKHNKTFHKIFPDLPASEDLLHAYICALQKEVPYHGRLYISENHICFHSSVLLKATKVVIPVSGVTVLKKQNMAHTHTKCLVHNALLRGEKFLFVSLRNREGCYKLLRSVCLQLEDGSTNSSPLFSSAENSFDQGKLANSSQSSLSLEESFDQLDAGDTTLLLDPPPTRLSRGGCTHTRTQARTHTQTIRDILSHTQTQAHLLKERNKWCCPPEGHSVHQAMLKVVFNSCASHSEHDDSSSIEEYSGGGSWVWNVMDRARSLLVQRESGSLNTLLLIYLILVVLLLLSSGSIGLRIVALEEQLTSLGALPEFTLQSSRYKDT